MMNRIVPARLWTTAIIGAAVVTSSLLLAFGTRTTDEASAPQSGPAPLAEGNEFGIKAPPPSSIEEILDRATSVVTGEYVEVVGLIHDRVPASAAARGVTEGSPISLMRFKVDEYIVGEGPAEFVVGQYGDVTARRQIDAALPAFGQEITLITTPWTLDPKIAVALYGDYGRLVERSGKVAYAFVDDATAADPTFGALAFAEGMSLDEFHETLREAARARGMVVPDR